MPDEIDKKILNALQKKGRTKRNELAELSVYLFHPLVIGCISLKKQELLKDITQK